MQVAFDFTSAAAAATFVTLIVGGAWAAGRFLRSLLGNEIDERTAPMFTAISLAIAKNSRQTEDLRKEVNAHMGSETETSEATVTAINEGFDRLSKEIGQAKWRGGPIDELDADDA